MRLLKLAAPFVDLALGFLFRDAIALLDFSGENLLVAFHLLQVVIGEFAPLMLQLAFELLPVARYLISVHESSP